MANNKFLWRAREQRTIRWLGTPRGNSQGSWTAPRGTFFDGLKRQFVDALAA
jgi:hypothetical protein